MASLKTEQLIQNPSNISSKIEIPCLLNGLFLPFDLSLIQRFVEYLITEKERSISHNLQMFSNVSKAQQGTFNICPSFDHVIWRRMFLTDILNMTSQILKKEIEKISSPYWVAKSNAALLNRPTHPAQTLINHFLKHHGKCQIKVMQSCRGFFLTFFKKGCDVGSNPY